MIRRLMRARTRNISFVVLGVTLGLSARWLCGEPAQPTAETLPEKFIRLSRNDRGQPTSLETAVQSFVADSGSSRVDLIGAVHVGDVEYYQRLNELFDEYDVVLYELVAPEGTRVPKGAGARNSSGIGFLQNGLKNVLGLEHQLSQIDYTKRHLVHADISPEAFAKSMEKRGESFFSMYLRMMGAGMAIQNQNAGKPSPEVSLLMALFSKNRDLQLKRAMAEQMEHMDVIVAAIEGEDGSTIIGERNNAALKVLRRELAAGKKKIAIFYGAAHLPDFAEKLQDDFAMQPEKLGWITAWNLSDKE